MAYYAGKNSASDVLMKFRQDDERAFTKDYPNLGDVRNVDYKKVASKPGEQYILFWKRFLKQMV